MRFPRRLINPSLTVEFEPRDLWVGVYFAGDLRRAVYVCIVPCLPIVFRY